MILEIQHHKEGTRVPRFSQRWGWRIRILLRHGAASLGKVFRRFGGTYFLDIYTLESDGTTIFYQRRKRFPGIAASYVRKDSQHTCRVHGINLSTKIVDSNDAMKIVPGYFTSCSK